MSEDDEDEWAWRRLAVHEAAHAVVALSLGVNVAHMSVDRWIGKGYTVYAPGPTTHWTEAVTAVAGAAALDRWPDGTDLAVTLEHIPEHRIEEALAQARDILVSRWNTVLDLARELDATTAAGVAFLPGERVV